MPAAAGRATLDRAWRVLRLDAAAGGDDQLVAARITEPVSKLDSARVLEEAGVTPASYPTVNRRLPVYARTFRQQVSAGDGFREPGFSTERRLEPQITIGLLTGAGHRGVHDRSPALLPVPG
jgi:hypothetical protein